MSSTRSPFTRRLLSSTLALLTCGTILNEASAQQLGGNQLDQSFGQGGRVATQFDPASPIGQNNIARTALFQPDGKILAIGVGSFNDGQGSGPALVRYFANGQLDYSFGNQGRVRIFPSPYGNDGLAAALQPDGRIIVAGTSVDPTTYRTAWMIARLLPGGQIDTSFGASGRVLIDPSTGSDAPLAVRLEADGRIVVAGSVGDAERSFAVARLNTNGSVDTTFAANGMVVSPFFGPAGAVTQAHFLADGRIAVAGPVTSSTTRDDIGLARYNANGTSDASFAKSTTDFVGGAQDVVGDLASIADGRIVVSGWVTYPAATATGASDVILARFHSDGTLDATFDADGKVVTDIISGMDSARAVVVQGDGKIVVAGDSANSFGSDGKMTLVRYNANGSKDSSFGSDGVVRTDFSDVTVPTSYGLGCGAFGVVIQPDGQLLATGTTVVEARRRHDIALARYRADSSSAPPPAPTCSATLTPTSTSFGYGGGADSFQVSMPAGCGWQAQSSSSWIILANGATGNGNGIVSYSVAANSSTSQRTGTIAVAGAIFTITQQGAPACGYKVSPTSASYKSGGGKGKVSVTASSTSCGWTAQSNSAWVTVTSGASGRGNGEVQYAVAKNQTGATRTGTLTVAGQTVTIQQSAGR